MASPEPDTRDTDASLAHWRMRADAALAAALDGLEGTEPRLHAAMRHAVLIGGKRMRPLLAYAAGVACGAPEEALDAPATAVELVHAYSLVHDDLPAMDDDALRRGQPTVHVAYGEATAILAGDALQALAFATLAAAPASDAARVEMLAELAAAGGAAGMCGGQAYDLAATGTTIPLRSLDVSVLAQALAMPPVDVEDRLVILMKPGNRQLEALRRLVKNRVVLTASVVVAATALGLLVFSPGGEASPQTTPDTDPGRGVEVAPTPVVPEIGEGLTIERTDTIDQGGEIAPPGADIAEIGEGDLAHHRIVHRGGVQPEHVGPASGRGVRPALGDHQLRLERRPAQHRPTHCGDGDVGLDQHAVGPTRPQRDRRVVATHPVAEANGPGGQRREEGLGLPVVAGHLRVGAEHVLERHQPQAAGQGVGGAEPGPELARGGDVAVVAARPDRRHRRSRGRGTRRRGSRPGFATATPAR